MNARHGLPSTGTRRDFDLCVPDNYRGPYVMPATGRCIWWTGRVAIGLRHGIDDAVGSAKPLPVASAGRRDWAGGAA